jgi:dihydrofolate reductase
MKVSIIAAIGKNREIGKDNDLLWHLPDDMRFFKDMTVPHHVVMGRKNYESIPPRFRPFSNRINIVITRNPDYSAPECYICHNLEDALNLARENFESETFIIGGAQIYSLALSKGLIDTMYLTLVDGIFPEADAFFPEFDESKWEKTELFRHDIDPSHGYSFTAYRFDRKADSSGETPPVG